MSSATADVAQVLPESGGRPAWRFGLTLALLVLALAGVAIAAYLAWENSQGKSGVCSVVHGCATVQESKYGKVLGVPVSVPGLGLYLVLAAAALVVLTDFRRWSQYATLISFYGAFFGFCFSVFLTYLEAFVIDAWCIYCIGSASLLTLLFAGWSIMLAHQLRMRNQR